MSAIRVLVSLRPLPRLLLLRWLIAAVVVLVVVAVGVGVVLKTVFSPKAAAEVVLTGATDPGVNPFMTPAASPPPNNSKPEPTLQPQGNGPIVTQPLPGDRDGLYGGTMNNAECDRDKMISFLSTHAAEANAFVEALNTDSSLFWSGGHPLTVADIPTYLGELTPTVLRLDTRVTNHGFDGTHPTTLQSVLQTGTAVFVDAHGVPRARCYCGNPLTAPTALTGELKPVGTPWAGYSSGGLAAIQPSKVAVANFVLFDVVSGQFFNRPAGTSGSKDTPHTQPISSPQSAPTTAPGPSDIGGTYLKHFTEWVCNGYTASPADSTFTVTHEGNTVSFGGSQTVTLNADGSFEYTDQYGEVTRGDFATEGGRSVIRGKHIYKNPLGRKCESSWIATKQ